MRHHVLRPKEKLCFKIIGMNMSIKGMIFKKKSKLIVDVIVGNSVEFWFCFHGINSNCQVLHGN